MTGTTARTVHPRYRVIVRTDAQNRIPGSRFVKPGVYEKHLRSDSADPPFPPEQTGVTWFVLDSDKILTTNHPHYTSRLGTVFAGF